MKIDILDQGKDFAEFLIEGERHTLPNLLKVKLLEYKEVEFVSYVLDHPTDKSAKFVIRTKGKTPKKVLESALKDIDNDLDELQKGLKKALK